MKNKVILFHGRASSFRKRIKVAPLALLHISSFLVRDGFEVKIISDILYDNYIKDALRECKDSICLGITAMTGSQITEGLKIAALAKQTYPNLPIVWGGWHPSIMPESTIRDPFVDIVVIGQGERKFYEIVKKLNNGDDLDSLMTIPGVVFKNNGQLILNNSFAIKDMNNFPPVPYDVVDTEKFLIKTEYGNRTLPYVSSYGCPYRCSFCIEPIVNRRRWVALSAGRVVDDWEYLYKRYQIDAIAIYDNNFFVDKKRVIDICNGLVRKNVKIKLGNVNGRISQLVKYEEDVWRLMEEVGLSMILTGSESGDQEVLDLIDKDSDIDDIYKFTELCKKYNIKILFSYMSGIPWSDNPIFNERKVNYEIDSILSQVDALIKISRKNRFMVYTYTPFPGSKMYQKAVEYGFKEPKNLAEWGDLIYSPEDIFQHPGCKQKWITPKRFRLITMLEQYIFGMMDLDARDWIAKDIENGFFCLIFKWGFNVGYFIARIRLKFKVFAFPVDYWFFVKFRKLIRIY